MCARSCSTATRTRSPIAGRELAERGVEHLAEPLDVTDEAAVERAMAGVVARFGRIDVLVNNAGIAIRDAAVRLSPRAAWIRSWTST